MTFTQYYFLSKSYMHLYLLSLPVPSFNPYFMLINIKKMGQEDVLSSTNKTSCGKTHMVLENDGSWELSLSFNEFLLTII